MMIITTSNFIELLVDDIDYLYFAHWSWTWVESKGAACRTSTKGKLSLHLEIARQAGIYVPGLEIDHKNRDSKDNRRENLRTATRSQNNMNRSAFYSSTSQYKGVCWRRDSQKWRAYIRHNALMVHLGTFETEIEAARKYNQAAQRLFGEFAVLNDVE